MPLSKVVSNSLSLTTLAASGAATLSSTLGVTGVTTVQAGTAALPALTTTGDTNTGIFFPAADTIAFAEGGAEAMRIDSSGNVGIGTTTPVAQLGVYGTGQTTAAMSTSTGLGGMLYARDSGSAANNGGAIMFGAAQGAFATIKGLLQDGASNTRGDLAFSTRTTPADATLTERVRINSSGNVGIGTTSQNEKLVVNGAIRSTNNAAGATATPDSGVFYFVPTADAPSDPRTILQGVGTAGVGASIAFFTGTSASNTERMRIDSSGGVRINNTSNATFSAQLNTQFTAGVNCGIYLKVTNTSASQSMVIFGNTNSDAVGAISTNASATTYATSSDYRLKESIAPMTGALAKVALLKPCTYKWKVDGSDGQGFIAHELDEVVPGCVTGEKDAVNADGNPVYQGIDTSFLVATLTAALQETKALIDTQAETINALTARITAQDAEIVAIKAKMA